MTLFKSKLHPTRECLENPLEKDKELCSYKKQCEAGSGGGGSEHSRGARQALLQGHTHSPHKQLQSPAALADSHEKKTICQKDITGSTHKASPGFFLGKRGMSGGSR